MTFNPFSALENIDDIVVKPKFAKKEKPEVLNIDSKKQFPSLSAFPDSKDATKKKKKWKTVEKMTVATNYEQSKIAETTRHTKQYFPSKVNKTRTNGFNVLKNKEEMKKNLIGSKACSFVIKRDGVFVNNCTRCECNYAHNLDEYNPPSCGFGLACRRGDCHFRHPNETVVAWMKRTKNKLPDLPSVPLEKNEVPPTPTSTPITSSEVPKKTPPPIPPRPIKKTSEVPPTPHVSPEIVPEKPLQTIRVKNMEIGKQVLIAMAASGININLIVEE